MTQTVDSGKIAAGRRSTSVRELEFELTSAATDDLLRLAGEWAAPPRVSLCTISKAEHGERLKGAPVKAVAPSINAHAGEGAFLIATLKSCLSQIMGNAIELGVEATDEGFVHELRVGLRRIRTALRDLAHFADGVDPGWEPVLGRAFQALGVYRDHFSVVPGVLEEMQTAGIDCTWLAVPAVAGPDPGEVVRRPVFQRTLVSITAFCHSPPAPRKGRADGRKSLRKKLARRLEKIHERLSRDAKRFPTLSLASRHRVRKRLKRLRYLSEFARPLFDGKQVNRYLAGWREVQDVLGRYNDYHLCLDTVHAAAPADPAARLALAWLDARLEACAVQGTRALRKAARRRVFWDT